MARWQLLPLGLGRRAIECRLASGRLHEVHLGVFAVGHPALSQQGRWMAAVLAGGAEGALSHRSAAELWGLLAATQPIHVTAPIRGRRRPGIVFHHARLESAEVTGRNGIPVTSIARTLLDLAAVAGERELERAMREAEFLRLVDVPSLGRLVRGNPGRRGIARLRCVLAARGLGAGTLRSPLESEFQRFLARRGLPKPAVNAVVAAGGRRFRVDCVWMKKRLIVELDGRAAHDTAGGFERDRERDRLLLAAGWRVVRITWRQLHDDPDAVEADLRALLDQRAA